MPSKFKIKTRVGGGSWIDVPSAAALVKLAPGKVTQHQVVVRLYTAMPTPAKLVCVKIRGTAAEYSPPPPDQWEHEFRDNDKIDAFTEGTATREVHAGPLTGSAILQVKEFHVGDRGPGRLLPYPVDLKVEVSVG